MPSRAIARPRSCPLDPPVKASWRSSPEDSDPLARTAFAGVPEGAEDSGVADSGVLDEEGVVVGAVVVGTGGSATAASEKSFLPELEVKVRTIVFPGTTCPGRQPSG